ncbi:MAG: heme lyase CcmF/NrfE family subunit [Pelagibacteraceae bacterium]
MASNFANGVLILSIFFSFLSNLFFFQKKFNLSIRLFNFSSILIIFTFLLLIYFFYSSNFSIAAVYENSHTLKPIFYKIAGTWGNHEGSLLLFIVIIAVYGSLFSIFFNKAESEKFKSWVIFFQNNLFLIFLIFLITTSNPFDMIIPRPIEGLGLNPILQDPLLVIHPPFLYLGYVGFSLTLSLVLSGLVNKNLNSNWAIISWPWVMIAWVFLTIGITLGSVWAYYELGWGGYWFWDPVENASLMPWLAGTALIHSMLVLKLKNQMKSWTSLLAIITFSFSLLGTFLVRSGVLNSVHAFANDPDRGVFILMIIFIITLSSLIIHILFSEKNKQITNYFLSKESFVNLNNLFLLFFLFVVLLGTIYPIILSIFDQTISVGPVYYNTILAPFVFIFLVLMSIGPLLKWSNKIKLQALYIYIYIFILCLVLSIIIIVLSNSYDLILFLGIASSLFLIFSILGEIYKGSIRIKPFYLPRLLSHLGVGIFFLSIFLNSYYSYTKDFEIKINETKSFDNLSLKFVDHSIGKIENYLEMKTKFEIRSGKEVFNLEPSVRKYFQPNQITSETSIKPTFFSNYYLAINFPDSQSIILGARYYYNYLIHGIWLGLLLIIFGGFLSVFKKRI